MRREAGVGRVGMGWGTQTCTAGWNLRGKRFSKNTFDTSNEANLIAPLPQGTHEGETLSNERGIHIARREVGLYLRPSAVMYGSTPG
jgi:hypothetical protein